MSGLSSSEIDAIEIEVGIGLPPEVREAYSHSNGLRGPTDIWLLFPRIDGHVDDIVGTNKMLKSEDWFPSAFLNVIIIGNDGCGGLICVSGEDGSASIWYPAEGTHLDEQRSSVGEIWDLIRQLYSDSEAQLGHGVD